ncbi:MAG: CotH kinase family protein [Bacteroidales bacterium]|nr:CotH kinase family protein [Bacteroidales bacterium]
MRTATPLFLLILPLFFGFFSCQQLHQPYKEINDDLDHVEFANSRWNSEESSLILGEKNQLVDNPCKSGKQAIRLDINTPFGLNYKIHSVKLDEFVRVEVSYCGVGELVLVASHKNADYFYRKALGTTTSMNDWQTLSLELSINPLMDGKDLNIYVWNPGNGTVYVDDFKLIYLPEKNYPAYDPMETMHIYIDTLSLIKLEKKREQAFKNGILETGDKDYVDGLIFYKDTIIPIDLRLKGDWLDHLEGKKWSFRVKVKQGYTWHKLKTFSIHTPFARDFMNEWMAHEVFRDADILAPRYGFVPVTLNGRSLGLYAWEEHFEKQLVESMKRREGPVLKLSEDHFWTTQKFFITDSVYFHLPFLQAAEIHAFKESKTLRDSILRGQFVLAANLMYQYKNLLKPVSEVFDLDKLAAYHALMDLTRGFHGLAWHNQRFYYNPVLCKLEPVFFDAYTNLGVFEPERDPISGMKEIDYDQAQSFVELYENQVFRDISFLKSYLKWLKLVSAPGWIDKQLSAKLSEINSNEKLIQREFRDYHFDRNFLVTNATRIRQEIPRLITQIDAYHGTETFNDSLIKLGNYNKNFSEVFTPQYVSAYVEDTIGDYVDVQVRNCWPHELWVVGAGRSGSSRPGLRIGPVSIRAFEEYMPDSVSVKLPIGNELLYLVAEDRDKNFSIRINPFQAPQNYSPEQSVREQYAMDLPNGVKVDGKRITFLAQAIHTTEPIVIPEDYMVVFNAGASLDLQKGAMFLCWSPLEMNGTADQPVRIYSSDKSAAGFTVLQAGGTCKLNHVSFSGLNTLDYNGWTLTGAVSFYESPVIIDSCFFENNVCEDALNIIRSHFIVSHTQFTNIFADAFDSDFCTGTVNDVSFRDIGSDAIDFSGSVVDISDCMIVNVGDKGVSCGENSILHVLNSTVIQANIAYASKDLSLLQLKDCHAEEAVYGLVAFQKKPEYGSATIRANQFTTRQVEHLYLIEQMSVLRLNNSIISGTATSVAKLLY